jgi:hypothetical protein
MESHHYYKFLGAPNKLRSGEDVASYVDMQ